MPGQAPRRSRPPPSGPGRTDLMAEETRAHGPGTDIFLSRLSDLLLVEVLRKVATSMQNGWLAATIDPLAGPALGAMHAAPGSPWTLASLPKRAGASRSGLSGRFRELVGESPGSRDGRLRLRRGIQSYVQARVRLAAVAQSKATRRSNRVIRAVGHRAQPAGLRQLLSVEQDGRTLRHE